MKKLATLFQDSYHELFRARTLTLCAMFGALSIVLARKITLSGTFSNKGENVSMLSTMI